MSPILLNTLLSYLFKPVERQYTFWRLEQPSKAQFPIEVTPSGIVMEVRLEHQEKAEVPIEVTLPEIVMEVRLEQ